MFWIKLPNIFCINALRFQLTHGILVLLWLVAYFQYTYDMKYIIILRYWFMECILNRKHRYIWSEWDSNGRYRIGRTSDISLFMWTVILALPHISDDSHGNGPFICNIHAVYESSVNFVAYVSLSYLGTELSCSTWSAARYLAICLEWWHTVYNTNAWSCEISYLFIHVGIRCIMHMMDWNNRILSYQTTNCIKNCVKIERSALLHIYDNLKSFRSIPRTFCSRDRQILF